MTPAQALIAHVDTLSAQAGATESAALARDTYVRAEIFCEMGLTNFPEAAEAFALKRFWMREGAELATAVLEETLDAITDGSRHIFATRARWFLSVFSDLNEVYFADRANIEACATAQRYFDLWLAEINMYKESLSKP